MEAGSGAKTPGPAAGSTAVALGGHNALAVLERQTASHSDAKARLRLGTVRSQGNGWLVRVKINGQMHNGPQRSSQSAA